MPLDVAPITWRLAGELEQVHTPACVARTLGEGLNDEWSGARPDLGGEAAHTWMIKRRLEEVDRAWSRTPSRGASGCGAE